MSDETTTPRRHGLFRPFRKFMIETCYVWRLVMSENRSGKRSLALDEQESGISKKNQLVQVDAQSRLQQSG